MLCENFKYLYYYFSDYIKIKKINIPIQFQLEIELYQKCV